MIEAVFYESAAGSLCAASGDIGGACHTVIYDTDGR